MVLYTIYQMKKLILTLLTASLLVGAAQAQTAGNKPATEKQENFEHLAERFADLQVLRYKIEGFESLNPKQKELCYYLYQAALSGRDMIWDQNYKHNLRVRKTLEAIISSYKGDKKSDQYQLFLTYAKRVFFSNGIHHHYSSKKIIPNFNEQFLSTLIYGSNAKMLPLQPGESVKDFVGFITPIICDPNKDAKKINLAANEDLLQTSAMNFYEGLSQAEVEEYNEKKIDKKDPTPISYGLNSKLVKENGEIKEKVWKVGGMYNNSIVKIVSWLEKAVTVAENENQKDALKKLITFYKTGSLKDFDTYNIAWVKDVDSRIDVVNGFIEVYGDPLGYRASYESVVSIKDMEASQRIEAIGNEAQYFEDNSPILPEHKKKEVTGISAKVITAVVESGDAAPSTPIGINLPNANWIRKNHGSKSVQISNIVSAYDAVGGSSLTKEFCFTDDEMQRAYLHSSLAGKLHTDMHEVIGHASGQILPGVGTPKETLKNYASALEEARADLVALYYMMDPKLLEIGVMPDLEVGMAEYDAYIRNGMLVQLTRLELGEQLEEAHMRNRAMIARWAFERSKGRAIVRETKYGKTYFHITDYKLLREIFGELLREVQRVISTGDYKAGMMLIEEYGVKVDPELHQEVIKRYRQFNLAPYKGFIQPKLKPVLKGNKLVDVQVTYPTDFLEQMLEYGKDYGFLPNYN